MCPRNNPSNHTDSLRMYTDVHVINSNLACIHAIHAIRLENHLILSERRPSRSIGMQNKENIFQNKKNII